MGQLKKKHVRANIFLTKAYIRKVRVYLKTTRGIIGVDEISAQNLKRFRKYSNFNSPKMAIFACNELASVFFTFFKIIILKDER